LKHYVIGSWFQTKLICERKIYIRECGFSTGDNPR
jgi:hypothetical protein